VKEKQNKFNRRNFLKTLTAAGLGSAFASAEAIADANEPNTVGPDVPAKEQELKFPQVPKRKLGKTGVDVPCLALGAMFDLVDNQIILRQAVKWGVKYWDTAVDYAGGKSELGIGKFLSKNPKVRKELFIVTRAPDARRAADPKSAEDVETHLHTSLKRMNTDYIDLYHGVHQLRDPARLTDRLRQWVKSAKKRGLIRFFGFSTHLNMPQCLRAAAELGWIDAIMFVYNFRVMQDAEMQAAIDACYKAGIGLTAMKTQAHRQKMETEEDKKLTEHFLQRGFTEGQAKIKVVLEDRRIGPACVGMENVAVLNSNVAAVLDKTTLTQADREVFRKYARATCSSYCAGCAHICNSALPDMPYISDIMRYLMYYKSYGRHDRAKELFAQIPGEVKGKLSSTDYSLAEARCPQHMPIAELIAEALSKLT